MTSKSGPSASIPVTSSTSHFECPRRARSGWPRRHVQIIASGSLDEYEIDALLSSGAPLDGFGVGTAMGVSADAPYLDIVYKLTSYAGDGRVKLSANKTRPPRSKAGLPQRSDGDRDTGDTIARAEEDLSGRLVAWARSCETARGSSRQPPGPFTELTPLRS